jgi:rhodanese-related sulfurtransferase
MSSVLTVVIVLAVVLVLLNRLKGGRVSSSVVKEKIAQGASVVDVRTPDEFRQGAYPGAVNIPLQVFAQRMGEIDRGRPVVVYCAAGGRSAKAAAMLTAAGYADVSNGGGLGDMPR